MTREEEEGARAKLVGGVQEVTCKGAGTRRERCWRRQKEGRRERMAVEGRVNGRDMGAGVRKGRKRKTVAEKQRSRSRKKRKKHDLKQV